MLDDYQDLIEELLGTPGIVRSAGELEGERLRLLAALHARDTVVLDRLQRMVRETSPHLKALPAFAEAVAAAELPDDVAALSESFDTTRGDLVSLLMNLTLRDWERTATHDTISEVNVVDEVEAHVEFDEAFRARFEE